jgi:transcriptional regulator with XRE-family HTH domain
MALIGIRKAMSKFGMRLKAARQRRHLTQKVIAVHLGITDVAYGDYERGRIFPTPENLQVLCELFDELHFDEMYQLLDDERRQERLHKVHHKIGRMRLLPARAAAPSGNVMVFVMNTDQEWPITIHSDPVLSSDGILTLEITVHCDRQEAKLDLIDLRSIKVLKTFDLPIHFLSVNVSDDPSYESRIIQMKRQNFQTLTLRKSSFAYRLWWVEEEYKE